MAKSVSRGSNKYIGLFERRIKDNFIQHCFADIEASTRCRTYKILRASTTSSPIYKETLLSSHRFMVERGRWMKPKVQSTILC